MSNLIHQPNNGIPNRPTSTALVATNQQNQLQIHNGDAPSSKISSLRSPTMQLEGHTSAIYSTKFAPNGRHLISAGHDRQILIWEAFENCNNIGVLRDQSQTGVILETCFSNDGKYVFSANSDKTVTVFDFEKMQKVKRNKEHEEIVNCISTSINFSKPLHSLYMSGSDDGTAKMYDLRTKESLITFDCKYPVLSIAYHETNEQLFTAGIDARIQCWDLRKGSVLYSIATHTDSITGISLSPITKTSNSNYLLSTSMDNSLRIFDVRPFFLPSTELQSNTTVNPNSRQVQVLYGPRHSEERNLLRTCWNSTGNMISAGSSDNPTHVYIFNVSNLRQPMLQYQLPGHKGSVNECAFSPTEPVIASASSDKTIFLGEIAQE